MPFPNEPLEVAGRIKHEIDAAVEQFVGRAIAPAPNRNPKRDARALWQVVVTDRTALVAEGDDHDPQWPFLKFRRWFHDAGRIPGLTDRLCAIGFPSEDMVAKWKGRLKALWDGAGGPEQCSRAIVQERLAKVSQSVDHEKILRAIASAVAGGTLDTGLDPLRRRLGVEIGWEEAVAGALCRQLDAGRPRAAVVALYPPDLEDEVIVTAFDVERRLQDVSKGRPVVVAIGDDDAPLRDAVVAWRANPPWLAIVRVMGSSDDDVEADVEAVRQVATHVVVFAPSDDWFSGWSDAEIVPLAGGRDRTTDDDHFDEIDRQEAFVQIFRAASLLTSAQRKLRLDQMARACGVDEARVREAVDRSGGLLACGPDAAGVPKVSRGDAAQAARFVARVYPSEDDLIAAYHALFHRLDPQRAEDARAVRNMFSRWLFARPRAVRLARRVLLASTQEMGKRRRGLAGNRVLEFAYAGVHEPRERLRWVQILAWMGEHQAAHDLLLATDRAGMKSRVETINARVFAARFRASGRRQFLDLGREVYRAAMDAAGDPNERGAIGEELAQLALVGGDHVEAANILVTLPGTGGLRRTALVAAARARGGGGPEVAGDALRPWRLRFELPALGGEEWDAYVERLLDPDAPPPVETLQQAADRALERGHFLVVERLVDHGHEIDPDNPFLEATAAKLLHERGRYGDAVHAYDVILDELVGRRHPLVTAARLDSALEAFRASQRAAPQAIPRPLGREPRPDELVRPYWLHLVALEVKACWYGVPGHDNWRDDPAGLCSAFLQISSPPPPALLNLAAKIRSTTPPCNFAKAQDYARQALEAARGESAPLGAIVALNTLAGVFEREAATFDRADDQAARLCSAADTLRESLAIDPHNSYTLASLARVLRALADVTADAATMTEAERCSDEVVRLRGSF